MTYFGPALDPPLGGSGRKTTTLVRDHEYFIPTKFHQNPSSGFGEEVENVKSLRTTTMTTTTDGRTDDGRCAMTIAHSSLWLRWANKGKGKCRISILSFLAFIWPYHKRIQPLLINYEHVQFQRYICGTHFRQMHTMAYSTMQDISIFKNFNENIWRTSSHSHFKIQWGVVKMLVALN